jgi:hypothetical protein
MIMLRTPPFIAETGSSAFVRHCEPPGPRKARPDDRLGEAIQKYRHQDSLDSFVAPLLAMTI